MKKTQNSKLFVVVIVAFLVTITLLAATGCEKVQQNNGSGSDNNEYYLVSEDFINGYASNVKTVYVQTKDGSLYVVADATDASVFEKYGVGLDFASSHGATGIYLPLKMHYHQVQAFLSYGDIAPVALKKSKDNLYSKEKYDYLQLYPVEFTGCKDYKEAMQEYDQVSDDFENVPCRCYTVADEEIKVYLKENAADGGFLYDISSLEPGLYFVNDTYGLIEIK